MRLTFKKTIVAIAALCTFAGVAHAEEASIPVQAQELIESPVQAAEMPDGKIPVEVNWFSEPGQQGRSHVSGVAHFQPDGSIWTALHSGIGAGSLMIGDVRIDQSGWDWYRFGQDECEYFYPQDIGHEGYEWSCDFLIIAPKGQEPVIPETLLTEAKLSRYSRGGQRVQVSELEYVPDGYYARTREPLETARKGDSGSCMIDLRTNSCIGLLSHMYAEGDDSRGLYVLPGLRRDQLVRVDDWNLTEQRRRFIRLARQRARADDAVTGMFELGG